MSSEKAILKKINKQIEKLTSSQQRIAEYILKNYRKMLFFTVEYLASQTRVSIV